MHEGFYPQWNTPTIISLRDVAPHLIDTTVLLVKIVAQSMNMNAYEPTPHYAFMIVNFIIQQEQQWKRKRGVLVGFPPLDGTAMGWGWVEEVQNMHRLSRQWPVRRELRKYQASFYHWRGRYMSEVEEQPTSIVSSEDKNGLQQQ